MNELSGIYLRVRDDEGRFVSRCFEDCTDEQQDQWLDTLDEAALKRTVKILGAMLRQIGDGVMA